MALYKPCHPIKNGSMLAARGGDGGHLANCAIDCKLGPEWAIRKMAKWPSCEPRCVLQRVDEAETDEIGLTREGRQRSRSSLQADLTFVGNFAGATGSV